MVCPNCHKEIDYVRYKEKVIHYGVFLTDENDTPFYESNDMEIITVAFFCPECDYELTTSETEMIEMLSKQKEISSNKNNLKKKYAV